MTNDEIIKKWENTSKYYDGVGGYITPKEILKMLNKARSEERARYEKGLTPAGKSLFDRRKDIEKQALADFCKELDNEVAKLIQKYEEKIRWLKYNNKSKLSLEGRRKIIIIRTGQLNSIKEVREIMLALKQTNGIE